MNKTWKVFLANESEKDYYRNGLKPFVESEYLAGTVYPEHRNIYRALELTPLSKVKVVILGQDPYHEPGQAMGMAFSVPDSVPLPPSLVNIYKELGKEYPGYDVSQSGDLTRWAKQGVLLLNTVLTVREHKANSHTGHGWETLTDAIIKETAEQNRPVVYMLWGRSAQVKAESVIPKDKKNILVLKTSHPSPLSVYRGFDGCGHFRACNEFLKENGIDPIIW